MMPIAAILLSAASSAVSRACLSALLMCVYVGANDWTSAHDSLLTNNEAVIWVTPAAFALLVYITLVSVIEARSKSSVTPENRSVYVPSASVARET